MHFLLYEFVDGNGITIVLLPHLPYFISVRLDTDVQDNWRRSCFSFPIVIYFWSQRLYTIKLVYCFCIFYTPPCVNYNYLTSLKLMKRIMLEWVVHLKYMHTSNYDFIRRWIIVLPFSFDDFYALFQHRFDLSCQLK